MRWLADCARTEATDGSDSTTSICTGRSARDAKTLLASACLGAPS